MSVLWLIALTVAFALLQAVIFHHFNLRATSGISARKAPSRGRRWS